MGHEAVIDLKFFANEHYFINLAFWELFYWYLLIVEQERLDFLL